MLHIAETVWANGFINLKQAFTTSFPNVTYNAKCLFLQMPLVCLRLDYKPAGKSECILIEYCNGVNYNNLQNVIPKSAVTDTKMNKSLFKELLALCQSDRERECAIFQASGVTSTQARLLFGFHSISERAKKVKDAYSHAHYIRTGIDKLAVTSDKPVLNSIGYNCYSGDE